MEQNIVTFQGENKNLLTRKLIDQVTDKLSIIVPETHNAILVKDGQMLQTLSSGKYLATEFVSVGESLEVLFMSKTAKLKLMWGTASKILSYDKVLEENYRFGVSGFYEVQIGDPRKCYLYLVGASQDLTADGLQERLMSNVVAVVEESMIEYITKNNIMFNQILLLKNEISQQVLKKLSQKLMREYGISVFSFNIANIIINDEDFARLNAKLKEQKQILVCSNCGTHLHLESKFCFNCGKSVGEEKVCKICQTANGENAKFCINCGSKLEED